MKPNDQTTKRPNDHLFLKCFVIIGLLFSSCQSEMGINEAVDEQMGKLTIDFSVSDGHRRHNYKTYNCDTDSCVEWHYQWFYMNWGWDGKKYASRPDDHPANQNGWYGSGVFQPTGSSSNYNNNLRMITGIR